jgi:hypothetical protein
MDACSYPNAQSFRVVENSIRTSSHPAYLCAWFLRRIAIADFVAGVIRQRGFYA